MRTSTASSIATVSLDGRWVAYESTESENGYRVYVKPFPALDARYRVSLGPSSQPAWSRDGRLFYLSGGRLLAATLTFSPAFAVTALDTLAAGVAFGDGWHANYDVSPDGKQFVFVKRAGAADAQVIFVHDWKYELRARMKAGGKQ